MDLISDTLMAKQAAHKGHRGMKWVEEPSMNVNISCVLCPFLPIFQYADVEVGESVREKYGDICL
jgi:hypothetical protein